MHEKKGENLTLFLKFVKPCIKQKTLNLPSLLQWFYHSDTAAQFH